jgi:hypothetical protein
MKMSNGGINESVNLYEKRKKMSMWRKLSWHKCGIKERIMKIIAKESEKRRKWHQHEI